MSLSLHDFRLSPAARLQWRRAAEELLIDAIFGELPPPAARPNYALRDATRDPTRQESCRGAYDEIRPRILVAAE